MVLSEKRTEVCSNLMASSCIHKIWKWDGKHFDPHLQGNGYSDGTVCFTSNIRTYSESSFTDLQSIQKTVLECSLNDSEMKLK